MTSFNRLGIVADHVNRHPAMRQEVLNAYPDAKFHDAGHRLDEDELINVPFGLRCSHHRLRAGNRAGAVRVAAAQDHQQVWQQL